jgi:HPt (histidine-containing phosphotransfer) domain-containing protein
MRKRTKSPLNEKIRVCVDEELTDLIPGFLENRRKDVLALRSALKERDYESIRSLGHSMRGAGGGYGFDFVTEIGEAIESAASQRNRKSLVRHIDALARFLEQVEVVYGPG